MAEAFDEQQQQNLQDVALVHVNEQVNISISNLRIALEKIQPNVIFKACLEVLKQQSFYNAFIANIDVPEIYMQQFWYTITQELSTQKFYFTMGDQVIEVNEDLLRNAFNITPKDLVHPFTPLAPEKEIIRFVNQIGCVTPIKIISALRTNDMQLPWRTFMTMINRCLTGKNSGHDRPRLTMLQLKGLKDPGYGMPITDVMFNKVIMASTDYSEYLAKSTGSTPAQVTCQGKGLLTKDGVEFTVKTTNEEEVKPLVRCRFTEVSIGSEAYQRTANEEERVDHSKKLKGLETLSIAAQLKLDMKKAQKASKDDFFIQQHSKGLGEGSSVTPEVPNVHILKCTNKGAGRTLEVLDEPSDASSSSSFDSEIAVEDISSDEEKVTKKPDEVTENTNEVTEKDDEVIVKPSAITKNVDYVTMADKVQPVDQQTRDEVHGANIEPVIKAQADVQMSKAQPKKPEANYYTVESEVQSMVDVPVKQATPASLRHPLVDSTITLIPDTTTEPPSQPPPTQPKRIKIK
ncbi:hypothetical protein Tco_1238106 [Tanacetum coccineum]